MAMTERGVMLVNSISVFGATLLPVCMGKLTTAKCNKQADYEVTSRKEHTKLFGQSRSLNNPQLPMAGQKMTEQNSRYRAHPAGI
jgi:hypothetical protein